MHPEGLMELGINVVILMLKILRSLRFKYRARSMDFTVCGQLHPERIPGPLVVTYLSMQCNYSITKTHHRCLGESNINMGY